MPTLSISLNVALEVFQKSIIENDVEKVYLDIQNNREYCCVKYTMKGSRSAIGVWGIYKFSQKFVDALTKKGINMEIKHVEVLDAALPPHLDSSMECSPQN